MSTAEWPRPSETALERPVRNNRSRARVRASGSKRRAEMSQAQATELRLPAPLAGFVRVEACPMDAEKWPVAPVIWWEPELPLQMPENSGLRNERLHKIRLSGFLNAQMSSRVRAQELIQLEAGVAPEIPATLPSSDLMPHGWDPRSASPVSLRVRAAGLGDKQWV